MKFKEGFNMGYDAGYADGFKHAFLLLSAVAVATLFLSACQPPTAPHEGDYGPTIVGAEEIVSQATLDTLKAEYADVSECLGVPMDERKYDMAEFHRAEDVIVSGTSRTGVRVGQYIYAVDSASFWANMRHELVHYISEHGPYHDAGFREDCV